MHQAGYYVRKLTDEEIFKFADKHFNGICISGNPNTQNIRSIADFCVFTFRHPFYGESTMYLSDYECKVYVNDIGVLKEASEQVSVDYVKMMIEKYKEDKEYVANLKLSLKDEREQSVRNYKIQVKEFNKRLKTDFSRILATEKLINELEGSAKACANKPQQKTDKPVAGV